MRIIVGPMPCQECKRPVYFADTTETTIRTDSGTVRASFRRVGVIADRGGDRHSCVVKVS